MKQQFVKSTIAFWLSLLFSFIAFCFMLVLVLKYGFGIPTLFNAVEPKMNQWEVKEPLGFNSNAMTLFGPIFGIIA